MTERKTQVSAWQIAIFQATSLPEVALQTNDFLAQSGREIVAVSPAIPIHDPKYGSIGAITYTVSVWFHQSAPSEDTTTGDSR